jgi:hypothetical protein
MLAFDSVLRQVDDVGTCPMVTVNPASADRDVYSSTVPETASAVDVGVGVGIGVGLGVGEGDGVTVEGAIGVDVDGGVAGVAETAPVGTTDGLLPPEPPPPHAPTAHESTRTNGYAFGFIALLLAVSNGGNGLTHRVYRR